MKHFANWNFQFGLLKQLQLELDRRQRVSTHAEDLIVNANLAIEDRAPDGCDLSRQLIGRYAIGLAVGNAIVTIQLPRDRDWARLCGRVLSSR